MEEREQVGVGIPTQDERDSQAWKTTAKRDSSPGAVTTPVTQGRILVLAATSPVYTPLPIGDLHSGLRMVVADLTQTFSPPPDPACGDQWRGANYVPTPVAELERLEEQRRELETEIRNRRAGYSISWTGGPSPLALVEPGLPHSPGPTVRRPQPSAFSVPRARPRPQMPTEAPPAYTEWVVTPSAHMPWRGAEAATSDNPAGPPEVKSKSTGNRLEATTMASPPQPPNNPAPGGFYLEQFIPVEKTPTGRGGNEVG